MSRADKWRRHRRCHAKIRAAEHYGISLNNQDLANIIGMIRNRKANRSIRVSTSKAIKVITYQGKALVALYSNRHHEIITFLPPDCRELRRDDEKREAICA